MVHIVPYLFGGLTAFLVMDVVPLPSPTAAFAALRAGISEPAPLLGTPAASVNRASKGDRAVTAPIVTTRAVKPVPADGLQEQARDRKPPTPQERKLPIGCEPSFSPVAAPSLAHLTGRCMA